MSKLEYYDPPQFKTVCRYSTTNQILDNEKKVFYFETYNNYKVPESANDKFHYVNEITKNRLDIVAADYYGYPTYWWVLAMANNIIDPLNVPIGTKLRIPQLSSLYLEGAVFSV